MNEELKEALKVIKKECKKHEMCFQCPFDERNINFTICDEMFKKLPYLWKLDD